MSYLRLIMVLGQRFRSAGIATYFGNKFLKVFATRCRSSRPLLSLIKFYQLPLTVIKVWKYIHCTRTWKLSRNVMFTLTFKNRLSVLSGFVCYHSRSRWILRIHFCYLECGTWLVLQNRDLIASNNSYLLIRGIRGKNFIAGINTNNFLLTWIFARTLIHPYQKGISFSETMMRTCLFYSLETRHSLVIVVC